MSIDFNTVLKDFDNKSLMDVLTMQSNGGEEVPLTLGRAASQSLMFQSPDEQDLSGDEKFRRGMLAYTIKENSKANLKVEDISLIKKQLAKIYSPMVIFRAYPLLDGAESVVQS